MSAAGGLTILGTLGILQNMYIPKPNPFDIIPVDIVSNGVLVATAYHGQPNVEDRLTIYNCTTTSQNPITMEGYKDLAIQSIKYQLVENRVFEPSWPMHSRNKFEFQAKKTV